jgi:hypothetical protein
MGYERCYGLTTEVPPREDPRLVKTRNFGAMPSNHLAKFFKIGQRLKYVQAAIAIKTIAVIQSEESLNPVFLAIIVVSLPMLWQKISQGGS